jgi:hypothetical protein
MDSRKLSNCYCHPGRAGGTPGILASSEYASQGCIHQPHLGVAGIATPAMKSDCTPSYSPIDCARIVPRDVGSVDLSDFVDSEISNLRISNCG